MSPISVLGISIIIGFTIAGFFHYLTIINSDELENKIEILNRSVESLKSINNNLTEEKMMLNNDNKQLMKELQEGKNTKSNLEEQLTTHISEVAFLNTQIDDLNNIIDDLNIQIDDLNKETENLIFGKSDNTVENSQIEVDNLKKEIQLKQSELDNYEEEKNNLQMQFDEFKENVCPQGEIINDVCMSEMPEKIILKSGYSSFSDSPFANIESDLTLFELEDFEENEWEVKGVSVNVGRILNPEFATAVSSVDGDDGNIDGDGYSGHSYHSDKDNNYLIFTFDENLLGDLPTHVGIVVTDNTWAENSPENVELMFMVMDVDGKVVQNQIIPHQNIGPPTSDDLFVGAIYDKGIKQMYVGFSYGSIEIDHVQFGIK
ncbi:hypothetical protein [Nitrosopumilus sp.]|uniref:hypothetical protein n=1 Tax=Nitrosopumilus sp. TaxID=2024843 RepID=UPI003B5A89BC